MRILITNDDGIASPGIHELARAVECAGYEVVVVAPDHDASGTATSLGRVSSELPVKMNRVNVQGLDAEAYSLAGPPALCVMAAHLEVFGPQPDLVISGINAGLNTGRSTLHSGTVGAVLTAQNMGLRGLAVSLETSEEWCWATAAQLALQVLPSVVNGPSRGAVSLNVPARQLDDIKGIRWAGLAAFNSVRSSVSAIQDGFIHFDLVSTDYKPEETTDLATVHAGYASLTALHGNVEVWGPVGSAGEMFEPGHTAHGASAGHLLKPPRSVLD